MDSKYRLVSAVAAVSLLAAGRANDVVLPVWDDYGGRKKSKKLKPSRPKKPKRKKRK